VLHLLFACCLLLRSLSRGPWRSTPAAPFRGRTCLFWLLPTSSLCHGGLCGVRFVGAWHPIEPNRGYRPGKCAKYLTSWRR